MGRWSPVNMSMHHEYIPDIQCIGGGEGHAAPHEGQHNSYTLEELQSSQPEEHSRSV